MTVRLARASKLRLTLLAGVATAGVAFGAAVAQQGDGVVARVNGAPVSARAVELAEQEIGQAMDNLPPQAKQDYLTSFLVDMKVLAQAAEKQGLAKDPAFEQRITYLRDKALMEELLDREMGKAVTDEAVKAFYEAEIAKAPKEAEVRARHILVESEDEAKALSKQLKGGGDFVAVAKEKTKDPSGKEDGGDLGFFTKDQMVPEFAEAAFAMQVNQVSEPVKSQFGWHVIKLEEKRERDVPKLEEVEDRVRAYLTRKAQGDLVTKLRSEAKIERTAAAPAAPAGTPPAAAPTGGTAPSPAAPAPAQPK